MYKKIYHLDNDYNIIEVEKRIVVFGLIIWNVIKPV